MLTTTAIPEKANIAAASDIGTNREENEDFYFYSKPKKFLAVCDGMGGHQKGALAGKLAGETLRDIMLAHDTLRNTVIQKSIFDVPRACVDLPASLPLAAKKLIAGVRLANQRILAFAREHPQTHGMGTTIIAAVVSGGRIYIAHVGDSRAYRLRDGRLTCLTTDHTWLNELIEDKEISQDQVLRFQKKNVLTRAIGVYPTIKIDLLVEPVRDGDLYLICTDGLFNALSDELLISVLSAYHGSLENKIANLVKRAKLMDGSDNITGGLIHIVSRTEMLGESTVERYTFQDEPLEVTLYLTQSLKSIYPDISKPRTFNSKKVHLFGLVFLVLVLSLLFFYALLRT
jgi:protein phosphatase